jgi:hypothetical protein
VAAAALTAHRNTVADVSHHVLPGRQYRYGEQRAPGDEHRADAFTQAGQHHCDRDGKRDVPAWRCCQRRIDPVQPGEPSVGCVGPHDLGRMKQMAEQAGDCRQRTG